MTQKVKLESYWSYLSENIYQPRVCERSRDTNGVKLCDPPTYIPSAYRPTNSPGPCWRWYHKQNNLLIDHTMSVPHIRVYEPGSHTKCPFLHITFSLGPSTLKCTLDINPQFGVVYYSKT